MNTRETLLERVAVLTEADRVFLDYSHASMLGAAEMAASRVKALEKAERVLGGYLPLGGAGQRLRFALEEYANACGALATALYEATAPDEPEEAEYTASELAAVEPTAATETAA